MASSDFPLMTCNNVATSVQVLSAKQLRLWQLQLLMSLASYKAIEAGRVMDYLSFHHNKPCWLR